MNTVLILFTTGDLGGAERSLTRMALCSSGVDYQLGTLGREGPWSRWLRQEGGVPLLFGEEGTENSGMGWHCFHKVIQHCREQRVAVIYVCGLRAALVLRFLRPFLPEVKLVHGIRSNPGSSSVLDRAFRLAERLSGALVDGWITNSQAAADTLTSRCAVKPESVSVVYNGLKEVRRLPERDWKRPVLLTVANLSPRKGCLEYLTLLDRLRDSHPEIQCVLVGRDDMSGRVQHRIIEKNLSCNVRWDGFAEDVSPWYRRASLFVLPSRWGEGCPTTVLEAFSHGLPVVAYAIDGIPELVEHGKDGLLAPPGNGESFLRSITTLIENPEMAVWMGESGRRKISERFRIELCAERHALFFRNLMAQAG